jgi:ribosome-binding factor A
MSVRIERVEELLKRELSELIRRELPVSEAGLLNINRLKVSKDLQLATVFIGVIGNADQKKRALALLLDHRKNLQSQLGRAVVLRYTPQLKFLIDESVEKGNRVLEILDEIDKSNPPQ